MMLAPAARVGNPSFRGPEALNSAAATCRPGRGSVMVGPEGGAGRRMATWSGRGAGTDGAPIAAHRSVCGRDSASEARGRGLVPDRRVAGEALAPVPVLTTWIAPLDRPRVSGAEALVGVRDPRMDPDSARADVARVGPPGIARKRSPVSVIDGG